MVYAFEGSRLTVAFYDALKGRPTGFEPREELIVLELSRKNADDVLQDRESPTPTPNTSGFALAELLPEAVAAKTFPQDRPSWPTMEGTVLEVVQDGKIRISLGSDDRLKIGDRLHVRRQGRIGPSQSLAIIVVNTLQSTTATCKVDHLYTDTSPPLPIREGDIAACWVPAGKVLNVDGGAIEISLGKDARLMRGDLIEVSRQAEDGQMLHVAQLVVAVVWTTRDDHTICTTCPGEGFRQRRIIRVGDWAIPKRTNFLRVNYSETKESDPRGLVDGP